MDEETCQVVPSKPQQKIGASKTNMARLKKRQISRGTVLHKIKKSGANYSQK